VPQSCAAGQPRANDWLTGGGTLRYRAMSMLSWIRAMKRSPCSTHFECAIPNRCGRRSPAMPLAIAFMLGAFCVAPPASAGLYKWVDSNGRVVYSDQPPAGDFKVETISGPPPPANPGAPQELANKQLESKKQQTEAAANAKKAVQQRADAERRVDACREARAEVARMSADQVLVYTLNEKGEQVLLNSADRKRRRDAAETFIKGNCPQG
jgi:hypothetical protein